MKCQERALIPDKRRQIGVMKNNSSRHDAPTGKLLKLFSFQYDKTTVEKQPWDFFALSAYVQCRKKTRTNFTFLPSPPQAKHVTLTFADDYEKQKGDFLRPPFQSEKNKPNPYR